MFYSPLRYPGGKGKLAPFMKIIIEKTKHNGGIYIEPFAGGAGIALNLLEEGAAQEIVINDYDKGIYSFWRAILTETDRFINDIQTIPLNIPEWNKQRAFCMFNNSKYSYELGFATFYLNRTNRSGIIKGGVIGGNSQGGAWKLDARFNRNNLSQRILNIAKKKDQIHLYNKDINSFLVHYITKFGTNSLVYFDPPYFEKGKQLYLNYFSYNDHMRIKHYIEKYVKQDWIITYDNMSEIAEIYKNYPCRKFDLSYHTAAFRKANELVIFKKETMIPSTTEMKNSKIDINLREIKKE